MDRDTDNDILRDGVEDALDIDTVGDRVTEASTDADRVNVAEKDGEARFDGETVSVRDVERETLGVSDGDALEIDTEGDRVREAVPVGDEDIELEPGDGATDRVIDFVCAKEADLDRDSDCDVVTDFDAAGEALEKDAVFEAEREPETLNDGGRDRDTVGDVVIDNLVIETDGDAAADLETEAARVLERDIEIVTLGDKEADCGNAGCKKEVSNSNTSIERSIFLVIGRGESTNLRSV